MIVIWIDWPYHLVFTGIRFTFWVQIWQISHPNMFIFTLPMKKNTTYRRFMYPHWLISNTVHVHMVSTCHWLSRLVSQPALLLFLTQRKGFHSAAQQTIISFFLRLGQLMLKHLNSYRCFIYIYLQWLVQFSSTVNKYFQDVGVARHYLLMWK